MVDNDFNIIKSWFINDNNVSDLSLNVLLLLFINLFIYLLISKLKLVNHY